jgi:hypothetical protein
MSGALKGGMEAAATASHADVSSRRKTVSTSYRYPNRRPVGKQKLRIICDDGAPPFIVRGQTAKAIRALVLAGKQGVTAQEVAGWAYRFAAYCHELRKQGLDIETIREAHEGGWHGRHVLHTAVRLEPVH